MITGQLQFFFGKAGRGQEFLDRKMGKLYNLGTSDIDNGKKTGASGLYHSDWIFHTPSLIESWGRPRVEIECQELRQFFDTERAGSDSDRLKQSVRKLPVCLFDLSQSTLIRLIECLR